MEEIKNAEHERWFDPERIKTYTAMKQSIEQDIARLMAKKTMIDAELELALFMTEVSSKKNQWFAIRPDDTLVKQMTVNGILNPQWEMLTPEAIHDSNFPIVACAVNMEFIIDKHDTRCVWPYYTRKEEQLFWYGTDSSMYTVNKVTDEEWKRRTGYDTSKPCPLGLMDVDRQRACKGNCWECRPGMTWFYTFKPVLLVRYPSSVSQTSAPKDG
jgi:hypothetical protein